MKYVKIALGLLLAQCIALFFGEHLKYQQEWVLAGELWRMLTAHFVHTNWMHTALNIGTACMVVRVLTPARSLAAIGIQAVIMAMGISFMSVTLLSGTDWFVGLSSVIHAYIARELIKRSVINKDGVLASALMLLLAKIAAEQTGYAGEATAKLIESPVFYDGHLFGVTVGISMGLLSVVNHYAQINTQTRTIVDRVFYWRSKGK